MDSFLCSAYSITEQTNVSVGSTKSSTLSLTVIVNVSIFDHVSRESQAVGYGFASTKCSKVTCYGVDAANGITFVALVANRIGSRCCTGSKEVNLTLPRSGICQVEVTVDAWFKSTKVFFSFVYMWFDSDGVLDEGCGAGIRVFAGIRVVVGG